MESKMRVCSYCRVSTRQEKQEMSLTSQVQHFNELIDSNPNYINVGAFIDQGISAKTQSKRLEFMRMITECRNRNIDIIYTKTVSRFGRNSKEMLRTIEELTRIGVRVIFEVEEIDTLRDKSTLQRVLKSYMAEEELTKDSEATRFGILRQVEQGNICIANKNPLIGYKYNKSMGLEINPPMANIVREIFARYTSGERSCDIIRWLNGLGVKTSGGKEWNHCSLSYVLKQEKYTGDAYFQKSFSEYGRVYRNRGEKAMYVVERVCPPIITHEMFNKARERMAAHTFYERGHDYVPKYDCFRGKMVCGLCGSNYNKQGLGHKTLKNGGKEKETYQCQRNKTKGVHACRNRIQDKLTLQDAFIYAYNKMKTVLMGGEKAVFEDAETAEINMRLQTLLAKEKIYLAMEAQGTMTTELAHQHNLIIDEVLALEKRKRQITKHNIEVVTRNNNITLCDELLKKYDKMETFDEEVFNQMVEQIVVMGKNRLLYKFKNGYTADIEVIDYYLERDEIGEVQIYASTKC